MDDFWREGKEQGHDDGEYVLGDIEEYTYEALQHPEGRTTIRLIHLHPSSNFSSPLVCTLSTTSIGHDGGDLPCSCAALSCAWDDTVFFRAPVCSARFYFNVKAHYRFHFAYNSELARRAAAFEA